MIPFAIASSVYVKKERKKMRDNCNAVRHVLPKKMFQIRSVQRHINNRKSVFSTFENMSTKSHITISIR